MRVVTSAQMRELDRRTIEEIGIPGAVLMENAGRGAASVLLASFAGLREGPVAVVCGQGNNGGDGFVVARVLAQRGIAAKVFILAPPERLTGDARLYFDVLRKMEVPVESLAETGVTARVRRQWREASCIVDALFGTGLARPVSGLYRNAIEAIGSSGRPVLAVDIPSGIDADTGRILGVAVKAQCTATFGFPKRGLFIHPGADHAGRIECVDIGIPAGLARELTPTEETIEAESFRGRLARRPDSHKGNYGHLFVLAGSAGKTGAACLAALGALRCGVGLVTVGIPASLNEILEVKLTEAMSLPLPDTAKGTLSDEALDEILRFARGKTCVAVGPGLGTEPEVERVIREVWTRVEAPMVWDADGLNLLARNQDLRGRNRAPVILTPHPGEMARLIGGTTRQVQEDRVGAAKALARGWGAVTVLKGSRTLVADPTGRLGINLTGNPGMAAGGMGDVLTGMIAALVCQGLDPYDAACLGVHLHGAAGDRASRRLGPLGFVAGDLLVETPEILRQVGGDGP